MYIVMEEFSIQIDDGSELLSDYVIKQNAKSVNLYDWQERAIEYFFKHNTTALYEVSTGAGKTYCAIEIIKKIWVKDPNTRVLIVVPKNVILETGWYKELYEAGIHLKDIGVYYGNIKEYAKITITNMQSLNKIALKLFHCVIFDEIHNYGTERLLPYLEYPFQYKIGLSATIERGDSKHLDIIKLFNYNVFKYTPKQALTEGVLNPFNFSDIAVEMDSITMEKYIEVTQQLNFILKSGGGFMRIMKSGKKELKNAMLSKMNERKQLVNNYSRKFDIVKFICQKHKDDKILVFSQFNEQTNKIYWYLLDIGIKARIIHSGIDKDTRDKVLTDFKLDKFNVLLTSRVLDEGYNLPKIDTAIITASDSTNRQTIQRMGRVLRKKEKNSNLYQIFCKDTMEEQQAIKRMLYFKNLSSRYNYYFYKITDTKNMVI